MQPLFTKLYKVDPVQRYCVSIIIEKRKEEMTDLYIAQGHINSPLPPTLASATFISQVLVLVRPSDTVFIFDHKTTI